MKNVKKPFNVIKVLKTIFQPKKLSKKEGKYKYEPWVYKNE
ncbi:MAG: hypothetical protein ACJA1H_002307 [Glaciecola sp.]|jgi:hypothetical protein